MLEKFPNKLIYDDRESEEDIDIVEKIYPTPKPKKPKTGKSKGKEADDKIQKRKDELEKIAKYEREQFQKKLANADTEKEAKQEGWGLYHKKKLRYGRGSPIEQPVAPKQIGACYVDIPKLKNDSILAVKYTKNRNFKISPTKVSEDVRDVILDIFNNKFHKKIYDLLTEDEKTIVCHYIDCMKLRKEVDIEDPATDRLYHAWQVAKGELNAGNNSPEVIKDLKILTVKLMHLKKINRTQGNNILVELSMM